MIIKFVDYRTLLIMINMITRERKKREEEEEGGHVVDYWLGGEGKM